MARYIPRLALPIVVALACSPATVARAQTSNWNVGSGNWNSPGNWDPSGVPGAGDTVDIINFDGVPRTITYNYTGAAVTLGNITIDLYGNISGGANILSMSSNSLTSSGIMYVGYNGNGEVDQSGGTVTLTFSDAGNFILGYNSGSSGTYNLSGSGVLNSAGYELIGWYSETAGTFNQTGGTNTGIVVDIGSLGTGTYNLHAGALQGGIQVGFFGTFNQFGGNATVPDSSDFSVIEGTYNLSDGNLTVTGAHSQEFNEDGNIMQSGGANSTSFFRMVTTFATLQANYTLSAGSLAVNAPTGVTAETLTGAATFTQTGGTNTIGGTNLPGGNWGLNIGYNNVASDDGGTTSTYSLSGTGVLTVNIGNEDIGYGNGDIGAFNQSGGTNTIAAGNYLNLGFLSGAQGTYTLSGGALSAGAEFIGAEGTGTFTQTGGTNTIAAGFDLFLGVTDLSSGTYNLGGDGALQTNLDEVVGVAGSGAFNQTGGTNTINGGYHLDIAQASGSTGDYTLSGGTANVSGTVYVGGFSGGAGGVGTLNVSDSGVLNVGGTLEVYNKAGNSLNLSGGTINTPALNFNGNPALLNWTGGTLNLTTDVTFDSAADPTSTSAAFGSALTLGTNQTLIVTGNETLGGVGPFALTLNPGSVHTVTSGLFLEDNGTLNLNGGTLNNSAFYQYGGTVNGTLVIPTNGTYVYIAGTFNGQLVNQGFVEFDETGFTAGNGMVNSGTVSPLANETVTFNGAGLINSSTIQGTSTNIIAASLTNSGKLSLIDSTLQAAGASCNTSTGLIEMIGGTLTGGPDSDHQLVNHGRINLIDVTVDGYLNCAADGVLNTAGSTTFNGNVTSSGQTYVGALNNTGVFQQIGGTLTGYGNFTNSGTAIFAGTQSWSPGTTFTNTAGSATFQSDAGSVADSPLTVAVNGGVVTFTVHEHLAALSIADPSGTLGFDLTSPTSFGKAIVNGLLTPGGTLQVSLTNNFTPLAGTSFDLLDWGSLSGTFSSVDLPTLNGHIVWDSSQLYSTGTISVVATYYAGDFNRDGHVDAADIGPMMLALTNLSAYKTTYDPNLTDAQLLLIGDINGDGVVNNADLQALLDLLNSGGGSSSPVPEPASWVLAFLALAMVSGTRLCVRCIR